MLSYPTYTILQERPTRYPSRMKADLHMLCNAKRPFLIKSCDPPLLPNRDIASTGRLDRSRSRLRMTAPAFALPAEPPAQFLSAATRAKPPPTHIGS